MKYLTILMTFLVICNVFGQPDCNFSFYDYIGNLNRIQKINRLLKDKQYQKALDECDSIKCYGISCRDKHYLMALSYLGLNKQSESKENLIKAIEEGLNLIELKIFSTEKISLSSFEIEQAKKNYLSKLDTSIRSLILDNCINQEHINKISIIDSIITNQGWPGINQTGHQTIRCEGVLLSKVLFSNLRIIDSPENQKYIDMIIKACQCYNEDWHELENLLIYYLERDLKNNKVAELRYFSLNSDFELNIENSLLQIMVLSTVINRNYFRVKLIATKQLPEKMIESNLKKILEELKKYVINDFNIILDYNQVSTSDTTGKVFFAIELMY